MIPCSRLVEYWRPVGRASPEHISKVKLSILGSVARHEMAALFPSRIRMLFIADFLKGFSGSAKKTQLHRLCERVGFHTELMKLYGYMFCCADILADQQALEMWKRKTMPLHILLWQPKNVRSYVKLLFFPKFPSSSAFLETSQTKSRSNAVLQKSRKWFQRSSRLNNKTD